VLATVIATSGSTYRRAGARMLLSRQGRLAGTISGGCLESDLVQSAWDKTANGPTLVTYDATSSEDLVWGFGLGCTGVIEVLLERLPEDGGALAFLEERVSTESPGLLATAVSEGSLLARRWTTHEVGKLIKHSHTLLGTSSVSTHEVEVEGQRVNVLLESIAPPLRLGVFGSGFDAGPLITLADQLGWTTILIDSKSTYANPERFPLASRIVIQPFDSPLEELRLDAAAVMSHNYLNDLALLKQLVPLGLGYIGLLGPRARAERLLTELARDGVSQPDTIRAPVGLDLGSEGPYEIALSIVAEILSVFRGRRGGALSARYGTVDAA